MTEYTSPMQEWACSFNGYMKKLYLNLVNNVKKRAKNLKISINETDLKELFKKQEGRCVITNKKMTHLAYQTKVNQHIMNNWNVSVDRIDSNKDYIKDNVQLVCAIVNRMKSDLTDNELLLLSDD